MTKIQHGLPIEVVDKIKSVFAKHEKIERVILYGSRAMNKYKPHSDIDLTLIAPDMELTELLKIETEIDDLLIPYKVDLSLIHQIDSESLIDHIRRVGVEF